MREIVVGVDHSAAAERALERALLEAATTSRPVRVINAWTTPVWQGGTAGMGYGGFPVPLDSEKWSRELAEEMLAKASPDDAVTAVAQAREGDPARVLVHASEDAGLVVVGGQGHGYLASALFGSTTSYVLHHSRCPVMVVPNGLSPAGPFQRVVVGLDGTTSSRAALRWALDAARRYACPLVAVHAWRTTVAPMVLPVTDPPTYDFEASVRSWLEAEVKGQDAHGSQDTVVHTVVRHGGAAAILMAEAGPDDLLVAGSRGRGGFAGLLLGSVATQCAQHAHGAVVVVRTDEERLDPAPA